MAPTLVVGKSYATRKHVTLLCPIRPALADPHKPIRTYRANTPDFLGFTVVLNAQPYSGALRVLVARAPDTGYSPRRPAPRAPSRPRPHPSPLIDKPVHDETLGAIYDLIKLGPTAANTCPARIVNAVPPRGGSISSNAIMDGVISERAMHITSVSVDAVGLGPRLRGARAGLLRAEFPDASRPAVRPIEGFAPIAEKA